MNRFEVHLCLVHSTPVRMLHVGYLLKAQNTNSTAECNQYIRCFFIQLSQVYTIQIHEVFHKIVSGVDGCASSA